MIEFIERNRITFQVDTDFPFRRYKPGKPKAVTPPALPPVAKPQQEITVAASKVGERAGRRLIKKTGRRASRITGPDIASRPPNVSRAGLKTTLG